MKYWALYGTYHMTETEPAIPIVCTKREGASRRNCPIQSKTMFTVDKTGRPCGLHILSHRQRFPNTISQNSPTLTTLTLTRVCCFTKVFTQKWSLKLSCNKHKCSLDIRTFRLCAFCETFITYSRSIYLMIHSTELVCHWIGWKLVITAFGI